MKNFFKKVKNNWLNFENKIENLDSRDKVSILIWMFSFLILMNFTDFSWFKADIFSSSTWTQVEESYESDIQNEEKTIEKESEQKDKVEIVNDQKNTEEIEQNTSEDQVSEISLEEQKKIEEQIISDQNQEIQNEILAENLNENKEIKIVENPVLVENSSGAWKISDWEIIISENISGEEKKIDWWKNFSGTWKNIWEWSEKNNWEKDFFNDEKKSFLTNIWLKKVDKNAIALKKLEEDEKNNQIEVVVETKVEDLQKTENISQNDDEKNILNEEKSDLDKKIEWVISDIQNIEEEKKQQAIIEEKAKQLAEEMLAEQKKSQWISESEFMVSWAESEAYNEMVRKKKKEELKAKYEKQISEQEKEKKYLADRLEMLENKLKNLQTKTPEQIAEEKQQVSLRQKQKEDEEKRQKELAEKKAEELKVKQAELEKKKIAIEKFNHDTDWDWLSDHIEKILETNLKLIDTDWDWFWDKREIEKFFDPNSKWWILFSDIPERSIKRDVIIKWAKKWLVFVRTGDKFLPDEEIYRDEAIKIIVSAMYPSEIYREDEFFEWVELHSDVSRNDDFARYLAIAIKHWILNWIVADNFNQYSTFSRADFISILVKATWKWTSKKKLKWVDTEYDNWFTGYLSKSKELWIVRVETFNRIFPLKWISRYKAVLYALRASKYWN